MLNLTNISKHKARWHGHKASRLIFVRTFRIFFYFLQQFNVNNLFTSSCCSMPHCIMYVEFIHSADHDTYVQGSLKHARVRQVLHLQVQYCFQIDVDLVQFLDFYHLYATLRHIGFHPKPVVPQEFFCNTHYSIFWAPLV